MKTYNQCLVRTPLGPITIINCTHNPYHISIFSAYLQKKKEHTTIKKIPYYVKVHVNGGVVKGHLNQRNVMPHHQ